MKKLVKGIVALALAGISLLSLSACDFSKIDDIFNKTINGAASEKDKQDANGLSDPYSIVYEGVSYEWFGKEVNFIEGCNSLDNLKAVCKKII